MPKITIKQHDITDCGAACLASISAHYKLETPIARIRQYASTDKKGTNVLGLLEAAKKLGFEAKGVRGDFDSLYKIPKPAIAHIIVKERLQHYVVIYEVTKSYVKIMDPGDGKFHKKSHEEFKKEWTGVLVLLLPNEEFTSRNEKVSVFKRFWFLLKPHKFVLVQAFFGALVYTLLGFSTSIYIQKITDYVLVGGNINLLNLLSIIMLILLALQIVISIFKDVFLVKTGQQIDVRLILGYYKHLLKLPQQFFDTMRVGEIISRINDAVKIRNFINGVALNLTVNVLIVIFSFALMFTFYWKLALIMTLIIPFYGIVYLITNKLNKKVERNVMEKSADLESQLVESLNSVGTIKRFGIEDFSNIKTETRFVSLLQTGYKSALNSIFSSTGSQFIARVFTIILLWTGSYFVINQEITAGELLSFYAIVGYLTGPVAELIGANKQIQNALIAADRLFEIMDLEREEAENKMKLEPDMIGDIMFKNVDFRYGSRVDVFKNFNLNILKGEITAIVGESGSGKSTLISLLQNIYPIQNGHIYIGKNDLKYIENESLRNLVSVVPQKIDLFAGNVIENIAVGEFQPHMQRIINICQSIGIIDFIEKLPNGFNTYLGENGASLSGGQKQRIAIARALYKNPEILVLDEATSSLDSSSENYIQNTIDELRKQNKTIIIIAHRLSTVVNADKIVVLEEGKVIEEGNHESLFEKRDKYYQLWKQQFPIIEQYAL
ncbi:peptidase domain-containing ABC transporter [Zunongwangia profunda]|uniref:Probable bacteriocin/lantibiotic ABC transporter, ATP-binding protein n=3 Tax=Zunongwangia profunda TaxID=398743 RepID=D5BC75_ZUNPS|nr:peptidase domain-containing ABC transporter [Zunongwangia profunda]MAB90623.1 peptide cleavage/export ABC transporter [Planctomycetota bacterium]MAG85913.1 peptide cleavage/export ABC transporter [Flavobacteriaceae bacterium]MAS71095.1 peptide cleavage/export ABC transporter [Zunongwangia sp.]ADF54701.1 probable bacteriocin/lantibiotic ABC transporter, ATP-binding protein [Zunongwangia profunda SM-A87]MBJ96713.1 peptide cleavage/export ABC transporter [Flavobacteriaceae bacterium]|tara:strand:+ start:15350 stop:17518 length:2169 start_codon:yes stop_codon:yes gene_type:complete